MENIISILSAAFLGAAASLFLQFCYTKENIFRAYYKLIAYYFYCGKGVKPSYYFKKTEVDEPFEGEPPKIKDGETFIPNYDEYGFLIAEYAFPLVDNERRVKGFTYSRLTRTSTRFQKFMRALGKPLGLCVYCQNVWVTFVVYFMLNGAEAPLAGALLAAPFSHCLLSFVKCFIDTSKTDWTIQKH